MVSVGMGKMDPSIIPKERIHIYIYRLGIGPPHTQGLMSLHTLCPYKKYTLTPPAVKTLATADVETKPKLQEHRGRVPLGEDVDEL
jgi:hypothetical protein